MVINHPQILGIVNITKDSFFDGGLYIEPDAAFARSLQLLHDGADIIDLGAVSSHPDSSNISPQQEIERLRPVVERLSSTGARLSIDTYNRSTQEFALSMNVEFINDITGFPDEKFYPFLKKSHTKLIVMHSVQRDVRATRVETEPVEVYQGIRNFFASRIQALTSAGIDRSRIIIDPGMGFFLSNKPEASIFVLKNLGNLKEEFGLPVLVSVSRKSFLRSITGRQTQELGPASVSAELAAVLQGADYIRTHEAHGLSIGLWLFGKRTEPPRNLNSTDADLN